jgi:hypothetical protein
MAADTNPVENDNAPANEPVIVELGVRSRKQIKKLRQGRGPIRRTINGVLDDLRQAGHVAEDAQVVIVMVKERPDYSSDYKSDCWRW